MKSKAFLHLDLEVDPFYEPKTKQTRARELTPSNKKQTKTENPKKLIMFLLRCFHRGSVWYFCQECNRGQYG